MARVCRGWGRKKSSPSDRKEREKNCPPLKKAWPDPPKK